MARKILLADDSVTAQNMGRRILTDAGYDVTTVNNGSAALKKIAELKPELIILDVYMPGYGGLEVCQRLKENKETARIPVLLTVGKLEPFKPEEARRVRADAFIVKPFEASELLTALTKLEDKIVPQAGPYKPGRFAKAIAAVEESELGERFGDSETGWKNRLIIPSPGDKSKEDKSKESEAETPMATNAASRDFARGDDFKPAELKSEFERPIPAGLPPDITPEEIAAITAAAAAVGGKVEVKAESAAPTEPAKSETAVSDAAGAETPAATFASVAQASTEATAETTTENKTETTPETVPVTAQIEPAIAADAITSGSESSTVKAEPVAEAKSVFADAIEAENRRAVSDPEVLAALASLGFPSNGDSSNTAQASDSSKTWQESSGPMAATVTKTELAAVSAGASGPRWIAESMPVPDSESTLMLEQEMEKAYAAFAAADAGRTGFATWSSTLDTFRSASAETTPSTVESSAAASAATASASTLTTESKSEEPAPSAATVSEPAASAVPEPVAAVAEVNIPSTTDATHAAEISATSAVSDTVVPVTEDKAAFAAAASAGSSVAEPVTASEPQPASQSAPTVSGESSAPAPAKEADRHREAELAKAWENWRQIRESAPGSQPTAPAPDAASSASKDKEEHSRQPEPETASAATESTEISSIVDTMLAELKPKLMEEIAKKMGNEKKKRKKAEGNCSSEPSIARRMGNIPS